MEDGFSDGDADAGAGGDHLSQLWYEEDEQDDDDHHQPQFDQQDSKVSAPPTLTDATAERMTVGKKAGMAGVDMQRVSRVVMELSKGSKFAANEERKARATEERVESMRQRLAELRAPGNEFRLAAAEEAANALVLELEAQRDLTRTFVHIDMDAFFVAVEMRDNPALRGKPVAVGGMSMLSTSNYEARKYGVRAAMPGFAALKLCPDLLIVPGDHSKYGDVSKLVMAVVAEYDPGYCAASVDEAYCDITAYLDAHQGAQAADVVAELRRRITHVTNGLTASAGIGPTRMISKIASDVNKPDGQFQVGSTRDEVLGFLRDRPARDIPGIGKVTARVLKAVLGIETCNDILARRTEVLALFSELSSQFFLSAALGLGSSGWDEPGRDASRKSVSVERTFKATSDRAALTDTLKRLCDKLEDRLRRADVAGGRTVTIKLKRDDFHVFSRARSRGGGAGDVVPWTSATLYEHALPVLEAVIDAAPAPGLSLRLMGVRLSGFAGEGEGDEGEGEGEGEGSSSQRPLLDFLVDPSTASDAGSLLCPVCGSVFPLGAGNAAVNDHLDACLRGGGDGKRERRERGDGEEKPAKQRRSQQSSLYDFTVPSDLLKRPEYM